MTQHQMVNIGIGNPPDAPLKYVAELRFPGSETSIASTHYDLICTMKARLYATSEEEAREFISIDWPQATIETLTLL